MALISDPVSATNTFDVEAAAELSQRLHQLAQPLTVLQGCLELILMGSHTIEEYKGSIQQALDESRRVSASFDRIREVVRNSQSATNSASLPGTTSASGRQETRCLHV